MADQSARHHKVRAAPQMMQHPLATTTGPSGSPRTSELWMTPKTGDSSRTWLAVDALIRDSAWAQHQ